MQYPARLLVGLSIVTATATSAHAIRPFVTDDARVVGGKLGQLETWLVLDSEIAEQFALLAIGPTEWLELTVGMSHGGVFRGADRAYSATGPILQTKVLAMPARNNRWPGVAISAGVLPGVGRGPLTPPGAAGFAYAAFTQAIDHERVLIHANIGVALGRRDVDDTRRTRAVPTAGLGTQVRLRGGFHGVTELYYGDPFALEADFGAAQLGFRHIFSEDVQIDGTFGSSFGDVGGMGAVRWATLGLRLVTNALW